MRLGSFKCLSTNINGDFRLKLGTDAYCCCCCYNFAQYITPPSPLSHTKYNAYVDGDDDDNDVYLWVVILRVVGNPTQLLFSFIFYFTILPSSEQKEGSATTTVQPVAFASSLFVVASERGTRKNSE